MLICDTHADTLFALAMGADEKTLDVTPESLKKGGVNVQTLAMFVGGSPELPIIRDAYQKMYAAVEKIKARGFRQVLSPKEGREGETAFLLSVEGCDLLSDGMDVLDTWDHLGVRMAALTWNYPNKAATPACVNDTDKLTDFGRAAVKEMRRRKMAVDVSHLNIAGFYDLLEAGATPLASHSCCRALCAHKRNLTDDQLRALFSAGGYVGVNFYPHFLKDDGHAALTDVADHLEHMLLMGGEGKIGFGSDFDGIECKPEGLASPADLPALMALLTKRFGEKITRGIAGENLVSYFSRIS